MSARMTHEAPSRRNLAHVSRRAVELVHLQIMHLLRHLTAICCGADCWAPPSAAVLRALAMARVVASARRSCGETSSHLRVKYRREVGSHELQEHMRRDPSVRRDANHLHARPLCRDQASSYTSPRKRFVAMTRGESKAANDRSRKSLTVIMCGGVPLRARRLGHVETSRGAVPPSAGDGAVAFLHNATTFATLG